MYATIKRMLEERKMTFYELSKLTGIRESVFTNLKNRGGKLSIENAVKVSDALKVTVDEIAR